MSQAQYRALKLLEIPYLIHWSRESVALRLQERGAPGNGIPAGHTPASARRLSDDALRGLLNEGRR